MQDEGLLRMVSARTGKSWIDVARLISGTKTPRSCEERWHLISEGVCV